jgi:hypothetical protein
MGRECSKLVRNRNASRVPVVKPDEKILLGKHRQI